MLLVDRVPVVRVAEPVERDAVAVVREDVAVPVERVAVADVERVAEVERVAVLRCAVSLPSGEDGPMLCCV